VPATVLVDVPAETELSEPVRFDLVGETVDDTTGGHLVVPLRQPLQGHRRDQPHRLGSGTPSGLESSSATAPT
jgi:hypothetical protein